MSRAFGGGPGPDIFGAWAADARRLAAHLSFSPILNQIKLESVDLGTLLQR